MAAVPQSAGAQCVSLVIPGRILKCKLRCSTQQAADLSDDDKDEIRPLVLPVFGPLVHISHRQTEHEDYIPRGRPSHQRHHRSCRCLELSTPSSLVWAYTLLQPRKLVISTSSRADRHRWLGASVPFCSRTAQCQESQVARATMLRPGRNGRS